MSLNKEDYSKLLWTNFSKCLPLSVQGETDKIMYIGMIMKFVEEMNLVQTNLLLEFCFEKKF